ncbi:hypothetical protein C5B94_03990 [Clavibacter michiganensis]|uniref:phage tail tube protein n=1 Tax=Clavibacter michiganensis TaxID=28447 RepID=UPI000CE7474D|nr:hypothetical protein [Clavibacter michiganensis]PPF56090.1 hypothetical protein C5B94_03990 [Clavibacter michiganensis]
MADIIEDAPPAVDVTGNLTIFWVPTIALPDTPTVAEIKAGKRITYSFTPDGWAPTGDIEKLVDARLSLPQDLEAFGKVTNGLAPKYVDSTDPNSAAVVLVPGTVGYFVERRNIPNKTDVAAGQKVRVLPATLGPQFPDAPANGKFTISQPVSLNGVVRNATVKA